MTTILFKAHESNTNPLVWDKEDSDRLKSYRNYQLKMKNGRDVPSLFLENNMYKDTLQFPQEIPIGSKEFFWPVSQLFVQNHLKRSIYQFPFLYVPKYIYTLKPLMALKFSAVYIFRRIFGEDNINSVRKFLSITNAYCTPGFQTLLALVEQMWETGIIKNIPAILSTKKSFMEDVVLSSIAENNIPNAFPHMELEQPTLSTENFSIEKQDFVKKQIGTRNDGWDIDLLHEQCICISCLEKCDNRDAYYKHIHTCLQSFYPYEGGTYACFRCVTSGMDVCDLLLHVYGECPLNLRTHCTYCRDTSPKCKCAGNAVIRQKIKETLASTDRLNADLLRTENLSMLVTFLEIRRNEGIMAIRDSHPVHPYQIVTMDMKDYLTNDIVVYVKQINDMIYFFSKQQSLEFGPCFRDLVKNLGIADNQYIQDIFSEKWKSSVSIDQDHRIVFDKVNLQEFCVYCLSKDRTERHMRTFHPTCFCGKGPFRTPDELCSHYAQHKIEKSCSVQGCTASFESLRDFVGHYKSSHRDEPEVFKIKCDTEAQVDGCDAGFMKKGRQAIHNLVYHVSDPEEIDTFFTRVEILMSNLNDEPQDDIIDVGNNEEHDPILDTHDTPGKGEQVDSDGKEDKHQGNIEKEVSGEPTKNAGNESKTPVKDPEKESDEDKKLNIDKDDKGKYPCPSDRCMKADIKFDTKTDLDKHIKLTHQCLYPECNFTSTEDTVLASHIQSHTKSVKGIQCRQCNIICADNLQLQQHMQSIHNYMCYVCKTSTFLSKTALDEHVKSCISAPFEARRDFLDSNPEDTPFELLIDLISQSGLHIDNSSLQAIKSASIKQNRLLKNPELNTAKTEVIFDLPIFPADGSGSLAIPSGRLKSLPKFRPAEQKPMENYLSMSNLIEELNCIAIEF